MKKALSFLLVVVMMCLLCSTMAGCGKQSSIYFLNFKPESADIYKDIAKDYEAETGVAVKVVTAAANTYEQTLKNEVAKSEPPTIFQINGPIGYESWKEYCADLTDSSLYGLLADKTLAIKSGDRVYGVPYVVEGYGIIYNDAIMKKYFALPNKAVSISTADEIRSFATLKAVVEDMSKHLSELSIKGVFASTSLASGEDWRWQTHLANIPFYHEFDDAAPGADPILTATAAKTVDFKYAQNFKNLFDLYMDNSVTEKTLLGSKSVNDSMAEFALGQCAMVQNGTWSWSLIEGVSGNTVEESQVKMLPLYTGVEGEEKLGLCVGTENYFAINSKVSAEKQQQSLDFLNWLFTSETGKKYVTEKLKFATPFSSFSADEQPDDPLAKEVTRYMADTTRSSVPWAFVGFPSENFKTTFGDALLEYAQGTISFDEVTTIVKNKWQSER